MKTTPWRKDALIYMPKKKKKADTVEGSIPTVGYVQGYPYPINIGMNYINFHTIRLEQKFRWGQTQFNGDLTIDGVHISSVPYWISISDERVVNVCTVNEGGESTFNAANIKRSNCLVSWLPIPSRFTNCWVFDYENSIVYDVKFTGHTSDFGTYIAPYFEGQLLNYRDLNHFRGTDKKFYALNDLGLYIYHEDKLDLIESSGLGSFARSHYSSSAGRDPNYATIMFTGGQYLHNGSGLTDKEISEIGFALHGYSGDVRDFTIQQYTI